MEKSIIVPGGIGDVYWVLVKLQSFCKREGITKPRVHILGDPVWESSRTRSVPFLSMVPFIDVGDPVIVPMFPPNRSEKELKRIYHDASLTLGNRVYTDFLDHDYFLCFNGIINTGHYLEEIDPELECDWYFPMIISPEQEQFQKECQEKYGEYAVFFFSFQGDFVTQNLKHFPLEKLAESINTFTSKNGLTPVFVGAWWDYKWPDASVTNYLPMLIDQVPEAVNLVGKTTLDQVFGVLRGAELVSGYHCGLTNMAIAFKKKTVLLWSKFRFPEKTPLAVAPPDSRMTNYIPLYTDYLTIDSYIGTMNELVEENKA